jgi:hypothetical protein
VTESAVSVAANESEQDRWLAPGAVVAVVAIGWALQIGNGAFHPDAVFWIAIGGLVALAMIVAPRPVGLARWDRALVPLLALLGLGLQLWQLFHSPPGIYVRNEPATLAPFQYGVMAMAGMSVSTLWHTPLWARWFQIAALVSVHFALGAWIIHQVPNPAIDVYLFHRDAITALMQGVDPYALTFPNIYGHSQFYGSGLSVEGRLQFGFPYFPLSLLTAIPGQLLAGDHRYSQLAALELAAILMAFARPRGFGPIAAMLYLTTPRIFFVLEQSWTEPFVVLGVAAVVFAACRYTRAVPWLFGALVALKQYLVFAVPAALLLLPRPLDRRQVTKMFGKAALVAAIVTLPFVLWDPAAFWKSVVTLQLYQPFRGDALSFLAWWAWRGNGQSPALVAFIAMAAAVAMALWRSPKTPAGFAAMVAVMFFAFFAFNKQAFCNYYFFVIGALAVSLAASRPSGTSR